MSETFADTWKNTKSQARNARNNKSRHKDKSKVTKNKHQPAELKVERPKLESNAFRYDSDKEDDEEEERDMSKDFGLLSKASITPGHFQFKSDKVLFDQKEYLTNNMFNLDIKLLSLSLSTIPFHLRHNIDLEYFSEKDLEKMNSTINSNQEKYEEYLAEKIENHNVTSASIQEEDAVEVVKDDCLLKEVEQFPVNVNDEAIYKVKEEIDKDKEELEDFLEELLDD